MTKSEARRLAAMTSLEEVRRFLAPVLATQKRKAQTRRERSAPRRAREAAGRDARRQAVARLRIDVLTVWDEMCAACGHHLGRCESVDWHLHHTLGGGQRRARESVATCVPLCAECHRLVHHGHVATLTQLRARAGDKSLGEVVAALGRRLDKINETWAAARAGRGGPDAGSVRERFGDIANGRDED